MKSLKEGKFMRVFSWFVRFKLIMKEDEVMWVGGRIFLVFLIVDVRNLMIFLNSYYVMMILIWNIYEVNGYCGVE